MADGLSKFALVAGVAALALSGYVAATAVPKDVAGRVDTLEDTVSDLTDAGVADIADRVAAMEESVVTTVPAEEFGGLTDSVAELAALVSDGSAVQDEAMAALEQTVGELGDGLAATEAGLEAVVADVTSLGETAEAVGAAVDQLSADQAALAEAAGARDGQLEALSAGLAAAATAEALDEMSAGVRDMVASGLVPVGAIVPWHPDYSDGGTVPEGFVICDGRTIESGPLAGQATPDLRGLFLVGGDEAGAEVEATTLETGGHAHDVTVPAAGDEAAETETVATEPAGDDTHDASVLPPHVTVVYVMRVE